VASTSESVFISYAGPDRAWAEWAGWHLREAGHEVELDVWDWRTAKALIWRAGPHTSAPLRALPALPSTGDDS